MRLIDSAFDLLAICIIIIAKLQRNYIHTIILSEELPKIAYSLLNIMQKYKIFTNRVLIQGTLCFELRAL